MTIILVGGPLVAQTIHNLDDDCLIYRRRSRGPAARYRTTGFDDASGRRVFAHFPPTPGEAEPSEHIHDA